MLTEVQMTNPGMLLRTGILVNAKIGLEKKEDALLLPEGAVLKEKTGTSVFIADDGKAKKMPVQTGFNDGTNIEIIAGIQLTNLAILPGQQTLRDNQPVKVVERGNPTGTQ